MGHNHPDQTAGPGRHHRAGVIARAIVLSTASLSLSRAAAQPCVSGWDSAFDPAPDGAVLAQTVIGAGAFAGLYTGGTFLTMGGAPATRIAKWDGAAWSPLGPGLNSAVNTLADFAGELHAGGSFSGDGVSLLSRVARWDGAAWRPLAGGLNADVLALAPADLGAGMALYAAGSFTAADGLPAVGVARWDGVAWAPLGAGLQAGAKTGLALAAHDDGSGVALYIGGSFLGAGGQPSPNIARWNGSAWLAAGAGLDAPVRALAEFSGALIAGGDFLASGPTPAAHLARWDGAGWTEFAGGANGPVHALLPLSLKTGPALVAAGEFTRIGAVEADRIAIFNGSSWAPLDAGAASIVCALARWGDNLSVGAHATTPGGAAAPALRRWILCDAGVLGDFNGDGVVDGVDLAFLLSQFGGSGSADLNGDGVVDGVDLAIVLSNFGP